MLKEDFFKSYYETCCHINSENDLFTEDKIFNFDYQPLGNTIKSTLIYASSYLEKYESNKFIYSNFNHQYCLLCTLEILKAKPSEAREYLAKAATRYLFAGSREGVPQGDIYKIIENLPSSSLIISGGARGVDTYAAEAARSNNIKVELHYPNWQLGKHAGMLRNKLMLDSGIDKAYLFIANNSKGSADTLQRVMTNNIPYQLLSY